jgi:3-dehydroquinate synthase
MDVSYEIALKERGRVVTGRDLMPQLPELLRSVGADRMVLLADAGVAEPAAQLAEELGAPILSVPGGEALKTWAAVEERAQELLEVGATRKTLLISMGGGATTDFGAFLAAVYMRGMRSALIPTTLLAMADAALGGKNGVDLGIHKNLLGAIRQPDLVVCDMARLTTLDDAAIAEGLVEVVKKAAMLDAEIFEALEGDLDALIARDPAAILAAVDAAVAMKLGVVQADAREADHRMLLNFGHTVGHALESLSGFALPHGTAVALGMEVECRMIESEITARLSALCERLPLRGARPEASAEEIWALMQRDKKSSAGQVRIAAPRRLGQGEVFEVQRGDLLACLN